jgi:hypothetical protein
VFEGGHLFGSRNTECLTKVVLAIRNAPNMFSNTAKLMFTYLSHCVYFDFMMSLPVNLGDDVIGEIISDKNW